MDLNLQLKKSGVLYPHLPYSPWDSPPPPISLEKVYVQHKYGFSVVDWCDFYKTRDQPKSPRKKNITDIALAFHTLWSRLSIFSHGIVAGIACCHSLAVAAAWASTQSTVPDFVHFHSLKIHSAIYVFTSLCVVSCFDRLDLGQLNRSHLRRIGRSHGVLLVTLGYLLSLALTLASRSHSAAVELYAADNSLWDPQVIMEWTWLVTTRDLLLLLCWIFMSCSTPMDFLQEKLISLNGSQEPSKPDIWHVNNV